MPVKLLNRDLLVRTLSGVAFLVVVVGAVMACRWSFGLLVAVVCAGCLGEFYRLAALSGARPQKNYGVALGTALVVSVFLETVGVFQVEALAIFIPGVFAIFVVELYRRTENPLVNVSATIAGLIYVALPLSLFVYMAFGSGWSANYSPWCVLYYLLIVWTNDVGAYIFGVALGRHRLFERHSPKKSWEGFVGGLLSAIAVGAAAGYWNGSSPLVWGGFALTVAVSGVAGDLVESMFKRSVGVKDSGSIMPGHGGFLDRFDAMLLSLPAAFLYFLMFDLW